MSSQFPYFASALVTAAVGAAASVVWAAQVPVAHAPAMAGAATQPVATPAVMLSTGNQINTPASTPVQPGITYPTLGFAPGQQVGTGGVPGTPTFTPGFGTTAAFAGTGMNQPGQAPFTEGFSGNQGVGSTMTQPGRPDFYDGFGFNRGVVPPNQGATPVTQYANYPTPPPNIASTTPAPVVATPPLTTTPATVGFFNGFGVGQPNVGFFSGFTTPR